VLETVNAGLKAQASSERAMFAGKALFAKSAEEEAKEAAAAAAAEATKAAEHEAQLKEWRDECDELRKRGPPNPTAELLRDAAYRGDVEARAALDKLAPITFDEFTGAKSKALAKEKARREEEAAARKAADAKERAQRTDVTRLEAEDEDEAQLLSGLSRGYKTRAGYRDLCRIKPQPYNQSQTPFPDFPSPRSILHRCRWLEDVVFRSVGSHRRNH